MAFAHPEYLVDTAWLAAHLDDPGVVVLDATTHLIPLRGVPGIFERALASIRLPFSKLAGCLQCTTQTSEGDLEAAFAAINAGAIHR